MKVAVNTITDKETIVEERVDAALWEMDGLDLKFIGDIELNCTFVKVYKEIIMRAEVSTNREITCDRCQETTNVKVNQSFTLSYNCDNLTDFLEVDDDIREQILLEFPMKVLCRQDCRGICPDCGVNLNETECLCKNREKVNVKDKKTLPFG
ncbi:MAG: DUF177 domain-containing protein [Candidatus Omnitrophica bacterium]|nr:DUF177 domain-containing protein [Candidatus Omnitrophota bacterium]